MDELREVGEPPGLALGAATAAFVHDTSVFGATSPIVGSRARLKLGGTGVLVTQETRYPWDGAVRITLAASGKSRPATSSTALSRTAP